MGNYNPKPRKLSKIGDKQWHSTQSQLSTLSISTNTQSAYSVGRVPSRTWSRSSGYRNRSHRNVGVGGGGGGGGSGGGSSRRAAPSSRSVFGSFRKKSCQTKSDRKQDYNCAKTVWPQSITESIFLPEFPLKGPVNETHFQVEGVLANGAFGKVLKVTKKDTSTTYVMKVLSKCRIIVENAVQQCKDEVTIQVTCGLHPFIVNCQYHWQSKKHLFLVTDYVEHGELLELWRRHGRFPERVALLFVAEIAIALDYLQSSGVIHRDLKMENVLLDADGHAQLIDFGLSKWLQLGERARTICGTIQYMAPEILRTEAYTHAVDWWSLGILLYSMLLGRYPLDGVLEHTKMSRLVADYDYSLSDDVGLDIRMLSSKLLCKEPSRRLQSLRQLRWEPAYADFDFNLIKSKRMSPVTLLKKLTAKLSSKSNECNGFSNGFGPASSKASSNNRTSLSDISPILDGFDDFNWICAADLPSSRD